MSHDLRCSTEGRSPSCLHVASLENVLPYLRQRQTAKNYDTVTSTGGQPALKFPVSRVIYKLQASFGATGVKNDDSERVTPSTTLDTGAELTPHALTPLENSSWRFNLTLRMVE